MKNFIIAATGLCGLYCLPASAVDSSPITTTNSLPVMEGSGLSAPKPATLLPKGSVSVSLNSRIESHANDSGSASEALIIDGEVHSVELALAWGFSKNWQANLKLKGLRNTAGSLDSAIDGWHDIFSLDDGDRSQQAQDQLRINYIDSAQDVLVEQANSSLADIQLSLSRQLIMGDSWKLALHSQLSLPNGKANTALGSDKADASLALAASGSRQHLGWHANIGALAIGDEQLFGIETKSSAWFTSLGTHWQPSQSWRWSAQVDGHSAVFNSSIGELKQTAWQLALAGQWRQGNTAVQAYFTEDLSVNRAADFAFGLNITFSLR